MEPNPSSNLEAVPSAKRIWRSWRRFGQWMGDRVARLMLTAFYFTIALPFGFFVKLTQDPLGARSTTPAWTKRPQHKDSLDQARRMF